MFLHYPKTPIPKYTFSRTKSAWDDSNMYTLLIKILECKKHFSKINRFSPISFYHNISMYLFINAYDTRERTRGTMHNTLTPLLLFPAPVVAAGKFPSSNMVSNVGTLEILRGEMRSDGATSKVLRRNLISLWCMMMMIVGKLLLADLPTLFSGENVLCSDLQGKGRTGPEKRRVWRFWIMFSRATCTSFCPKTLGWILD